MINLYFPSPIFAQLG